MALASAFVQSERGGPGGSAKERAGGQVETQAEVPMQCWTLIVPDGRNADCPERSTSLIASSRFSMKSVQVLGTVSNSRRNSDGTSAGLLSAAAVDRPWPAFYGRRFPLPAPASSRALSCNANSSLVRARITMSATSASEQRSCL